MELRQLSYFVSVAEHLHFGRAASSLSTGQPAVSQQVARLERELGVRLFDRSRRTVRLTEAGQRLLPEARTVLWAAERARAVAREQGSAPALRLGSSTGMGDRLDRFLAEFGSISPGTPVDLVSASTSVRLQRVAGGQLDAAFVRGVATAPGVELIEVWRDRLLIALPASHPLAGSERLELAELAPLPLSIVSREQNPPLVDLVTHACGAAGFVPKSGNSYGALENTLAAIAVGTPGWTVLYEAHARLLRHPLVAFVSPEPELALATALAVPAGTTSRTAAPLLRACAAVAAGDGER